MGNIEISPYGNLLVYKKDYTPDMVLKIIQENKLNGLRIFSILKEQRLDSISFLKDFTFLEHLDITFSADFDFDFLRYLKALKGLSISGEGKNEIDLSELGNLEYLSIQWRNNVKGIEKCVKLRSLALSDFKQKNFSIIESLTELTDLRVKTSTIQSLQGLGALKKLTSLLFGNCKKLAFLGPINNLMNLEYLEFNICPTIKNLSELTNLPNLEALILSDCSSIDSIGFLSNFPLLSTLGLLGNTKITDGDLLPAQNINSVVYNHQSHYNISIKKETDETRAKSNLEKLKNIFKSDHRMNY